MGFEGITRCLCVRGPCKTRVDQANCALVYVFCTRGPWRQYCVLGSTSVPVAQRHHTVCVFPCSCLFVSGVPHATCAVAGDCPYIHSILSVFGCGMLALPLSVCGAAYGAASADAGKSSLLRLARRRQMRGGPPGEVNFGCCTCSDVIV